MKIDKNKAILIFLIIAMLLPSSFSFIPVSIFMILTVIIGIIFIYFLIIKKQEIISILKNKFVICNFIFSYTILISLVNNYETIKFNDFYEVLKYIIFPIITVIIISICKEKKYYVFFLKTISITMIIICIFGIIQYFNPFSINEMYIKTYAPTQYRSLINNYPTPRIVGIKSNPSVYGILVSIGIYFNLMLYEYKKYRKLSICSIILCFINLMMTLTRAIQIAFIVSIVLFIIIKVFLNKGWKNAVIATVLTIVCLIILLLILPESLTWRLTQVFDLSTTTSWLGRTGKWKEYIDIIKENSLFGIGPVKNHITELGYIDSELIQTTLQYGIIGFIFYLTMLLSPLHIYIKSKNKNIIKYYLPILILILINNIASSTLILFDTAISIYIIIGMIFVSDKIDNAEKKHKEITK